MYKNSAMLKIGLSVAMLSLAAAPAFSEEGGGAEATPQQMPDICKSQAATQKLSASAAEAFVQKCTAAASANPGERKSSERLEGTK